MVASAYITLSSKWDPSSKRHCFCLLSLFPRTPPPKKTKTNKQKKQPPLTIWYLWRFCFRPGAIPWLIFLWLKLLLIFILLFYVLAVLPAYMSVYHMYAWCSQRPREGIGSCETVVTDDWEPCCRTRNWTYVFWEKAVSALNWGVISPVPPPPFFFLAV